MAEITLKNTQINKQIADLVAQSDQAVTVHTTETDVTISRPNKLTIRRDLLDRLGLAPPDRSKAWVELVLSAPEHVLITRNELVIHDRQVRPSLLFRFRSEEQRRRTELAALARHRSVTEFIREAIDRALEE